ncbi:TniB family NTP-binding protein [Sphaerisporangium sp. NBC_01403]|uniref:TniB family NTP-binding protein n=1 Tax=Sphaerisporangium sp. NBC_01403 TaxID=2903599 RepID=UPI003243D700
MTLHDPGQEASLVPFPAGPVIDRATIEGWARWRLTRRDFKPAPVISLGEYKKMSPRQRYLHDLHRIATHSNLPIQETPMSAAVDDAMRRLIQSNAVKRTERTRPGLMVNGGGFQGKTETVCETAAEFEDHWLELNNYLNPDAVPGTRDLIAPVAYVQTPVTAKPVSTCQAILDFFGEDYKNMNLPTLTRTVRRALKEHATRVLILDDITRLKMHREADQDVLDFIRDLMNITVVVLVGVGISKSGLLREGRQDTRTGEWVFPPVKDKSKSPNDEAVTQTERRFKLVNLDPFSYDTPQNIAAWVSHLGGIESQLRLFNAHDQPLTNGTMPEYLYRRTGGVVGLLGCLIEEACMAAIDSGQERLDFELLEDVGIHPGKIPGLNAEAGEVPAVPEQPAKSKSPRKKRGRNTVFDDRGGASAATS